MPEAKKILAWHFTDGLKLRDGQPLEVGKTYTHKGKVKICESGYHASEHLLNALQYAPGAQVSRVECWGSVKTQSDKLVAKNRKVLWTLDATMVLHEFACRVAEQALAKIDNPDPRSLAAVEAKRKWMRGEITIAELAAAWDAAQDATWSAAQAAAWYAARAVAWSAAQAVAQAAAWSATWSAAQDATWYAARSEHNDLLTQMVEEAHTKENSHD